MIDDHQQFLIDLGIKLAKEGDYSLITSEQIDAIIADRQALLDATISKIIHHGESVI